MIHNNTSPVQLGFAIVIEHSANATVPIETNQKLELPA